MNQITSRAYQDETDLQIILDLMPRVRPVDHVHDYPVQVDIEENLASAVVRSNTRLWFEGQQLVAWAYVDLFNNLCWDVEHRWEDLLGNEIIEWGEACIRTALGKNGSSTLDSSCKESYSQRIAFLIHHGFSQTRDTTVGLIRSLSDPLPDPVLPSGFTIRPILGKAEAESVAVAHRMAFGTQYMTTESRLVIMSTSEYDMSLDLVAVAPDGSVAGNCICSINETTKIGFTDPISIRPTFQRMGLARGLLLTGMRLLKERGMTSAHLGTSGYNTAMQRSAEAVGFKVDYRTLWFSKKVHAAA